LTGASDPDPDLLRLVLAHVARLLDLSQAQIAAAAGVDASLVSRLMSGDRALSASVLAEIAAALGVMPALLERLVAVSAAVREAAREGLAARSAVAEDLARELGQRFSVIGEAVAQSILGELPGLAGEWARVAPGPSPADLAVGDELWANLEGSTATGRLLLAATQEYRQWGLCVRACAESAAADDPEQALDLARFALEIAETVGGSAAWRQRLAGYAWAHVAQAEKAARRPAAAKRSLAVAKQLWQAGAPGDPALLDEARFLGLQAALRK